MHKFKADIDIIGINPYVSVPDKILKEIFNQAGRDKGHIPVHGTINGKPYKQTLVKYAGEWRLYINTQMIKNSPKLIGETVELTIELDPADRTVKPHPKLTIALDENEEAKTVFDKLAPSRQN